MDLKSIVYHSTVNPESIVDQGRHEQMHKNENILYKSIDIKLYKSIDIKNAIISITFVVILFQPAI
jgi:hypothetical protein